MEVLSPKVFAKISYNFDEKYNNQKPGLCSDSGFPQIADNSDISCLGIGGRRLSAFDLIYCDTILGRFRILYVIFIVIQVLHSLLCT